jgi:hypothetical protein
MAIATIKIHPFRYANFVHLAIDQKIPGQAEGDVALDVGQAFPTDEAAATFWDELKAGWIMHCRQRRSSGGQS